MLLLVGDVAPAGRGLSRGGSWGRSVSFFRYLLGRRVPDIFNYVAAIK